MKKTYKGGSKIFVVLLIILIIGISAIMFGYGGNNVQEIKSEAGQKAGEIMEEHGDIVIEKVVDSGKEKVGEALKEVGEKILEENNAPGYYGNYGDDGVSEYENVVVFFTADWCPSCVEAEKNIESEKNDIPTDVAIVKVDFDDDDLKQNYGVSKQHTFVLINEVGEENKKWVGSKTLAEIIDNIK
ncbi:MAG: thioredoxin family protein [Candidatus Moraniibacteriota bacterium]|jgi:thiol-disulfide isomerase/thioredoxin